jgi:hypothetical protein
MNDLVAELRRAASFESKRVELRTPADFDQAEKLVDDGWYIIWSSPFSVTLQRQKES